YANSDFLVNISNIYADVVPSKIFELFSLGKPIVNFVKNKNDFSLKYFEAYPLCFNFYEWEDFGSQVSKLKIFMEINKNRKVNSEILNEIFYKNQPEYT